MQTGKTDRGKYAPDKPQDCAYCYFWHSRKQKCTKKRCYYLLPEERQDSICRENGMLGDCKVCPYGQHSPCIGYCLQKILLDLRQCR
ncbi:MULTISPECIES: hypothetical protein [Lachnospiraceae]|uniref:hypothetical protein n=1 Tax=Lachnospiraceae TaxID=186803 RepID=UPI001F2AAD6C|nr:MULTISPECIES: hypothetical protein [Lachnospiraceae]